MRAYLWVILGLESLAPLSDLDDTVCLGDVRSEVLTELNEWSIHCQAFPESVCPDDTRHNVWCASILGLLQKLNLNPLDV